MEFIPLMDMAIEGRAKKKMIEKMIQLLGKLPLIAHAHIHSLAHSRKHQRLKLGKKMKKNIDALETLSSLSFHSLARSTFLYQFCASTSSSSSVYSTFFSISLRVAV